MITKFNTYINESLRDKLKGKSKEDIFDNIKDLSSLKKLESIERYNLRHLFTDDEYKNILELALYDYPIYVIRNLKYNYNTLSKILSEEQIKNGITIFAREMSSILRNSEIDTLSKIFFYLYKEDYIYSNMDNNSMWFKHLTKDSYSGGHISVNRYTTFDHIVDYVEKNK